MEEMFAGACRDDTAGQVATRVLPDAAALPYVRAKVILRETILRILVYLLPSLWLGAAVAGGALAQDRTQAVEPTADAKKLTETGKISASETMTYTIDAKSGHSASVTFRSNNAKCTFVIYGPGQTPGENAPMFDSAASGNQFSGFLPATGRYLVRISLSRDAARGLQACDYTVTFAVAR